MKILKKSTRYIFRFCKKNLLVSFSVAVSIGIVIAYQLSYDLPEWYHGAGRHFTVLYDISMAVIGSFIFYIILDYVPQEKKNRAVRFWVLNEYKKIIDSINFLFEDLSELYIRERKKAFSCTQDDIKCIVDNLRNSDIVSTQIMFQGNMNVIQAMERCKNIVNESVNVIISNFSEVLTTEEIEVLSKFAYGKMHRFLDGTNLLYGLADLVGDDDNDKFNAFIEYQSLLYRLVILTDLNGLEEIKVPSS